MKPNEVFLKELHVHRKLSSSLQEFRTALDTYEQFDLIVSHIEKLTEDWARTVGILEKKPKKTAPKFTEEELEWKTYWDSHAFEPDMKRNMMDALFIVTGINHTKFMKSRDGTQTSFHFPEFLVIVPKKNSGGHNYEIGESIIRWGHPNHTVFFNQSGNTGNSMDQHTESISLPTATQIRDIVSSTLYINRMFGDEIVAALIVNWMEEEE